MNASTQIYSSHFLWDSVSFSVYVPLVFMMSSLKFDRETLFYLSVGNTIHFRFNVGNGIQTLEQVTAYPLNDDQWHTIHVERNRRQATLKVDQQAEVTLDEPIDQGFRTLDLSSALVIGKTDYISLT